MLELRRDRAIFVAVLCTAFLTCTAAHAAAGTGGAPIPALLPATAGAAGYGDPNVASLVVAPIAVLGKRVVARGTMPAAARREVILQRLDGRDGWRNVARTRVRTTQRFEMRWKADRSGAISLRAVLGRRARIHSRSASAAAQSPPTASVHVYRSAQATFYGPGFFGKQTACGQLLTPDMHGVAHKRLPCGTLIAVTYAGREIVVPVIDRGPFNGDYSWDLTQATADALGFTGADEIGYARASPAPPA